MMTVSKRRQRERERMAENSRQAPGGGGGDYLSLDYEGESTRRPVVR